MSHNNTSSDIWIAGAVAAFTVDLLVYPLDTLKTRLQSPDYARLYTHSASSNGAAIVNRAALSRGLYQGVGSVIIATLPSSGAFFTTYEGIKYTLNTHNPSISTRSGGSAHGSHLLPQPLIHSTASAVAELVSCAILTPAEVIKQNAQMVDNASPSPNSSSKPKTNATMQTLARFRANPLALWRGYTALAGRNLPFTALQFPMFERLKEYVKQYRDRKGTRTGTLLESGLITAVSAGTAGSVSAVVTTPIDVVKTRIMLAAAEGPAPPSQSNSKPSSGGREGLVEKVKQGKTNGLVDAMGRAAREATAKPAKKKSGWTIGKEIMQEQGYKGLFRGGALRGVWTMLGSGLYLGVYESGRVYLARRRGMDIDEDDLL